MRIAKCKWESLTLLSFLSLTVLSANAASIAARTAVAGKTETVAKTQNAASKPETGDVLATDTVSLTPSKPNGVYLAIFGGAGHSGDTSIEQNGTVFFGPAVGGPIVVRAHGDIEGGAGFAGAHVGYEWPGFLMSNCPEWSIAPAIELESYYLKSSPTGHLHNPTLLEHTFVNGFTANTGILLANAVVTFKDVLTHWAYPYAGVGVGFANIAIDHAESIQIAPAEPDFNHFNSNSHASDWTFASQAKVGVSFDLLDNWRLFVEYRLLYLSSTDYQFGATDLPTHAATSNWKVNFGGIIYHMGDAGLEYNF